MATDGRTGKRVAIKQMVIAKQVKQDIIVNEIMIMKESHHPSIVNYIDSYIVEGTLWVCIFFPLVLASHVIFPFSLACHC